MANVKDLMGLGMPAALARVVANLNSADSVFIGAGSGESIIFGKEPSTAYMTLDLSNGRLTTDATNFADIIFGRIGSGIQLKQGANGRTGTFTCNGATSVAVSNTSYAAGDVILISLETVGGTVGAIPRPVTLTPTTGFEVAGTALDTSVYRYILIRTNA